MKKQVKDSRQLVLSGCESMKQKTTPKEQENSPVSEALARSRRIEPGGCIEVDDPRRLLTDIYDKHDQKNKGSNRFHQLLHEIGKLHDKKRRDYGSDEDPFANVRASSGWGIKPWVGAMNRATDKVKRLQKYAISGTLSNEGARDSFMDLAVYALISCILWEEQNE